MKKIILSGVMALVPLTGSFAQNPYCMGGLGDILCQSFQLQQQFQEQSRGNRSGGINDERIYNPDAGAYAEEMAEGFRREFEKGFDERFSNPYRLNYDPTKDRCLLDPQCDMTAKGMVHYQWLYEKCTGGNQAACQKLQAGAGTPAPSGRYPNGERMNVPYVPGTEPVPGR